MQVYVITQHNAETVTLFGAYSTEESANLAAAQAKRQSGSSDSTFVITAVMVG